MFISPVEFIYSMAMLVSCKRLVILTPTIHADVYNILWDHHVYKSLPTGDYGNAAMLPKLTVLTLAVT